MKVLESFLKTGRLGPIHLGATPGDVESLLGEPEKESASKNPLVLKYGPLQLSFWRRSKEDPSGLKQIAIDMQGSAAGFPLTLAPNEWFSGAQRTHGAFVLFLESIGEEPLDIFGNEASGRVELRSGVVATFQDTILTRLEVAERKRQSARFPIHRDGREPTVEQIMEIIAEAHAAAAAGASQAAFMVAWSAAEAILRQYAVRAGMQRRIGVQPSALIAELQARGFVAPTDFAVLDGARKRRTVIAHGLIAPQVTSAELDSLFAIISKFLAELIRDQAVAGGR